MAIQNIAPAPAPATTGHMETIDTCLALFREAHQPMPKTTFLRRLKACGVPTKKVGGLVYVPWSLVLPVHRDWVLSRMQRERR